MKLKSKSSHHKTENTFKFQTFAERLTSINVDVARRVQTLAATPEDADTFFREGLVNWTDLNCTQYFINYHREVFPKTQSLAQLIFFKDEIVEITLRHLQVENSLALQPLLDLVVQFARDLQADFYPYFDKFFNVIVKLLSKHHHETDTLEQAFTCMAYLFKFLWRTMLKDIERVYELFSPLLGNRYKEHINTFAAESFAYLMRKVKDHDVFFHFLFARLESHPEQVEGVGRLLFEMIKGVQKQLHSVTNKVLPVVLDKLGNNDLPVESISGTLQTLWTQMALYVAPEHAGVVWQVMEKHIEDVHNQWSVCKTKKKKPQLHQHLHSSLKLLKIWIEHNNGALLTKTNTVTQVLIKLLDGNKLSEDLESLILEISSNLLFANKSSLPAIERSHLLTAVYRSGFHSQAIISFTARIHDIPLFEKDALGCILDYCNKCCQKKELSSWKDVLLLLAELVLKKSPPPTNNDELVAHEMYSLDVGGKFPEFCHKLSDNIQKQADLKHVVYEEMWAMLICLPHLRSLDAKVYSKSVQTLIVNLLSDTTPNQDNRDLKLQIYGEAMTALVLLTDDNQDEINDLPQDLIFQKLKNHPAHVQCLRATLFYLTKVKNTKDKNDILTLKTFMSIFEHLKFNLSSCFSKVRLLTLEIFNLFSLPLPNTSEEIEQLGVFEICIRAEKVPATVHTYRQKLVHIRRLEHEIIQNQIPVGPFQLIPLRYLIGTLYVNFTLIWDPIKEVIKSHAQNLGRDEFWEVYKNQLDLAATASENALKPKAEISMETEVDSELESSFRSHADKVNEANDRPDSVNFRHLLWSAMQKFPEVCEPRSRIISPLFMRFLENEYYPADLSTAPTQDISRSNEGQEGEEPLDVSQTEVEIEIEKLEEEELEMKGKEKMKGKVKKRRAANKTLVVHLKLFSKFRNPRSIHLEPTLKELYQKLLYHHAPDVQKTAYDCIMTYQYKYLVPYNENFEKLLDDKSFKNEIVLFSLDAENCVVKNDHREGLIPVLLRILYGKMLTKTGKDTSGRANSQLRKNIVMQFLAGLQQEELKVFMDLIFEPFKHFFTDNLQETVKEAMTNVNFKKIIPLGKQLSILNTIEIIYKKLGSSVDTYLPSMLQVVVCLLGIVNQALNTRDEVHPKAVMNLRTVRQMALARINHFFSRFESYVYTQAELQGIFEAGVWPQVERLQNEGIYHPTGILRLCQSWSQDKKFWPLLGITKTSDPSITPLPYVFGLLSNPNVKNNVIAVLLEIIDNLLQEFENEEEINYIEVENTVVTGDKKDLGVNLLLPHVPVILAFIKKVVEKMVSAATKQKTLPVRELDILSRLSQYVEDKEQCEQLIAIMLPFLGRRMVTSQDVEVNILVTINHLLQKVDKPGSLFICDMVRLFGVLGARTSRNALCTALQVIKEREPSFSKLVELATQLNSWDKRRVEEPDYMQRLQAFQESQKIVKEMETPDIPMCLMLINNSCYFLSKLDDMALRDHSTLSIQAVLQFVSKRQDDVETIKKLILSSILPEIKLGIRHKQEVPRHEYITILSNMVKLFPSHPLFADLVTLCDEDVDVDFYSNITHIQQHRRARALRRLGKHFKTHPFHGETLSSYVLPMVTSFVMDDTYMKNSNLIEAATETIGIVCAHLPWPRYILVLRHYLNQLTKSLDNQKLMVKIVVSVLDSFHYDLKNSTFVSAGAKFEVPEEKKTPEKESEEKNTEEVGDSDESEHDETEMDTSTSIEGPVECAPGLATKIHRLIVTSLLPQLQKCLIQKAKSDDEHKKANASKYAEDEEILRVPIAITMVKLLQSLPQRTLHQNLPGVLLKVCQFLKSRSRDIREAARDTLIKIMQALGARYFSYAVREMRSILKRGYQVHVLSYTVFTLLKSMSETLKAGDLDDCITMLVQVFNEDMFGEASNEKEVDGITGKLMEARTCKSYDSYQIVAKFVGQTRLLNLVTPLKELLDSTHSHKVTRKVEESFKKIGLGLIENPGLDHTVLLTFVFALTQEALPILNPNKSKNSKPEYKRDSRLQPPSTYLLKKTTPRGGFKPKVQVKTNLYVLVEFGLQVLHFLLKKGILMHTDTHHLQLLDPFIAQFPSFLSSKHIKVIAIALKCIVWLLKFPLPSLKEEVTAISNSMFVLLNNYAVAGAAQGADNFELVVFCFKAMTVLVRDVKYHSIDKEQLQVLLGYAESDIHDHTRQATAFTLLKAVLSRKLVVDEMYDVMFKVQQLAIRADSAHVRRQCRQVSLQFLLDYPLGSKLRQQLEFFVIQLEYEHETGRESSLEMLATIFNAFPQALITEFSGMFFVPLASRLVNDDSVKCRKFSATAIKELLNKLDSTERDKLFSMCIQWLQNDVSVTRKVGALSCALFVEVEGTKFEHRLKSLLPAIEHQTQPDKYELDCTASEEKDLDLLLFSVLNLILKVQRECGISRKSKRNKEFYSIWENVEHHLCHPHTWVRLVSSQILGLIFSSWTPEELVTAKPGKHYMCTPTLEQKIHNLSGLCYKQFTAPELDDSLADQVLKNLVFLGKVILQMPQSDAQNGEKHQEDETEEKNYFVSFNWLLKKMLRESNMEAANHPSRTIKRCNAFKWVAAMGTSMKAEQLKKYLDIMLPPVVREYSNAAHNADQNLKTLSQEVLDILKSASGVDVFSEHFVKTQKAVNEKRESRKRQKATEAISNPEISAKRKMKKHFAKQEAKKRKNAESHGRVPKKKHRS